MGDGPGWVPTYVWPLLGSKKLGNLTRKVKVGQKRDVFQAFWGLKMVQKHSSTHSKWWGIDQGGSRPMSDPFWSPKDLEIDMKRGNLPLKTDWLNLRIDLWVIGSSDRRDFRIESSSWVDLQLHVINFITKCFFLPKDGQMGKKDTNFNPTTFQGTY